MPRKSTRKTRKNGPTLRERVSGIFAESRPAMAWVSWIGAVALVATGAVYGVPRLEERLPTVPAEAVVVTFQRRPAWVHDELAAELAGIVRAALSPDPLARADLVAAHDALLATGWFSEVVQVRRLHAGAVRVSARFAAPFAVVRDADGDHLLSADGRLLPRSWRAGDAPEGLRRIQGTYFARPDAPGRRWDGSDIGAAIAVLRLCEGHPWSGQIVGADTSRYLTEGQLHLITDRGSRVVWGAAPGDEAALEVTAAEKLRRLDTAAAQCGHVDCGFEGEVDLTNPAGVMAR